MSLTLALIFLPELLWLLAVAALALLQDRFVFRPGPPAPAPPDGWAAIHLPSGQLLGWWRSPVDAQTPVILLFHGNRGGLLRLAERAKDWPAGILLATYQGYEGNAGTAGEAQIYQDAQAALDWLREQGIRDDRIVLYGESLGSGPAVWLASQAPFAGLALEAPFTSLVDLASARYPWAPVRWLLRHRFDNLSRIECVKTPILILHGDADATTPC